MKDIAVFGAGGFGRETALMIRQINKIKPEWNLLGFFDDGISEEVDGMPVLGDLTTLNGWQKEIYIAVAVANPQIRKKIVTNIINPYIRYPVLIHPLCQTGDDNNTFGKGCILTSGCVFTTNIHLDDFVIVNLLSTVGHDVTIGDFSTIMPNCSLSGFDKIGSGCMIGAGARILQNLSIGINVNVGAGAVVTKNVEDNITVAGVPASRI